MEWNENILEDIPELESTAPHVLQISSDIGDLSEYFSKIEEKNCPYDPSLADLRVGTLLSLSFIFPKEELFGIGIPIDDENISYSMFAQTFINSVVLGIVRSKLNNVFLYNHNEMGRDMHNFIYKAFRGREILRNGLITSAGKIVTDLCSITNFVNFQAESFERGLCTQEEFLNRYIPLMESAEEEYLFNSSSIHLQKLNDYIISSLLVRGQKEKSVLLRILCGINNMGDLYSEENRAKITFWEQFLNIGYDIDLINGEIERRKTKLPR